TPGSTAFDSSVTAPITRTSWADTREAKPRRRRTAPAARTRLRIMFGAPWKGRGARRSRLGACYLRHPPPNALELDRRRVFQAPTDCWNALDPDGTARARTANILNASRRKAAPTASTSF